MELVMRKLARIREANDGVIPGELAAQAGISTLALSRLCGEGKLVRVAKGMYVFPKDPDDKLAALAHEKDFVYSHITALFLDGLVDSPEDSDGHYAITCKRDTQPDPIVRARCEVHYVDPEFFDLGKTLAATPAGNLVPAYDAERSVCDVARARGTLGTEAFLTVITRYANSSRFDGEKLYFYADRIGVGAVLRRYFDILHMTG